jgi:hypothetical protein
MERTYQPGLSPERRAYAEYIYKLQDFDCQRPIAERWDPVEQLRRIKQRRIT